MQADCLNFFMKEQLGDSCMRRGLLRIAADAPENVAVTVIPPELTTYLIIDTSAVQTWVRNQVSFEECGASV